mmetsp:Transcript_1480/g.3259  ORF Transcript_1480/g.3259 Transcript_1480/m.3259 type:complete len:248 (-) Transcript_1480:2237-2980(-)
MEEAEAKDQSAICFRLLAITQHPVVALQHGAKHVRTQPFGRLIGHLHTILQEQRREHLCWHRGEPQAIVVVCLLRVHLLADCLKLWKPGNGQMAIAKQHPATGLSGLLDELQRLGTLALTQRDALQLAQHTLGLRKCHHVRNRITSSRQDKDQWRRLCGVLIGDCDIKRRGFDELLAHLCFDKVEYRHSEPIRADCAKEAHLLKRVPSIIPLAWNWHLVSFWLVINLLELASMGPKERVQPIEGLDV